MPIAVDVAERLDALARATVAVAARRGAARVTLRHVAAELGGSTTLVTNYLPSRTAVVANALGWIMRCWERERAAALAGVADGDRLAALARWACTTTPADDVFRGLLVELLSRPDTEADAGPFVATAREHHAELRAAARAAGVGAEAAGFVADAVFLLVRGAHFAAIEEPGAWDARLPHLVARTLALLAPAPATRAVRAASALHDAGIVPA